MAEEKRKKEEYKEFQRKVRESIRDEMSQKRSNQLLLDESTTQLKQGGGDEKDESIEVKGKEEVEEDAASDKPNKGGQSKVAKKASKK